MLKMPEDKNTEIEEPPSRSAPAGVIDINEDERKSPARHGGAAQESGEKTGRILNWIKTSFKNKPDSTLRETIEEYIEENPVNAENEDSGSLLEKSLISNVLKLRDMPVEDVMIPRANIIAIEQESAEKDLLSQMIDIQYSRLPVYKEELDNVIGTIHIKDVLSTIARGEPLKLESLIREVPIVAPSMHILDLLLDMRQTRKHMAMVVDEFGGIDGLVTMGDIIEEIVGQLEDEHDTDVQPRIVRAKDGSFVADTRYDLDEFEETYGKILTEEEREDNDTIGGLVFYLAGRIPEKGEVLTHSSGMVFEVLDADQRRVNRVKITNIPRPEEMASK